MTPLLPEAEQSSCAAVVPAGELILYPLEGDVRGVVVFLIGTIGAVAIAVGPSAAADSLKSVVRTLNAIVNPEDAWRLEDQARRYHRPNEERYWRNYGAGLEQRRDRREAMPLRGGWHEYSTRSTPTRRTMCNTRHGAMVILPSNTIGIVIAKGSKSAGPDDNRGRPVG